MTEKQPHLEMLKQEIAEANERFKEAQERELAREGALPFIERTLFRKRHMYKGWMFERVIEQADARAVITQSNYGYKVLNTPELGMIDVDFDLEFTQQTSAHLRESYYIQPQEKEALSNLRDWVAVHPKQNWRPYRTAAGLRFLRTDAPQPLDESYDTVCLAIEGADILYHDLCKEQQAFRARVSPQPARCGIAYPRWNPYDRGGDGWSHSDPTGAKVTLTIKAYEIVAEQFKVCELIENVGSGVVHPDLAPVLTLHDEYCKVSTSLPLEPLADDETSLPSIIDLLAFTDAYRPEAMAPNKIWAVLGWETQNALKHLDNPDTRQRAIADYKRLQRLAEKWHEESEPDEA
jgi:hypothetical protein